MTKYSSPEIITVVPKSEQRRSLKNAQTFAGITFTVLLICLLLTICIYLFHSSSAKESIKGPLPSQNVFSLSEIEAIIQIIIWSILKVAK